MSAKVYVASMNMRGKWAEPLDPNAIKINVTSAQGKSSENRKDFSPMTPVEGGYKGYWNFESYWQSGKVFKDLDPEKTKKWWKELKEPKRRYPNSKGKKVLYATWDEGGHKFDYVDSRKAVYVPEYFELIKERRMTHHWKAQLATGQSLVIYDFDGPRSSADGSPICREVTIDLLREKINDPSFPFGHGYIVAATIAGIEPHMYV
jgi:hypothetical protein